MKYKCSGFCSSEAMVWEDDWMLQSTKALCSPPGPGEPIVCTPSRWSELTGLCFTEWQPALCPSIRPCNSLNRCVHKLAFPSFPALPPCLKRISRTPHPWTCSSLSWVRAMPPIFVGGPKRGLFHIMLHKPALNLGGRAIRRWTHCGPREFSNMAAPPTPPHSRQALNQRWGSWLYAGLEISAGEMIPC